MRTLMILFLFAFAAAAQTIDSVRPECAGPGGRILLCGDDFGEDPLVLIDGVRARVLRNTDAKILAVVPRNVLPGAIRDGNNIVQALDDFLLHIQKGMPAADQ